MSIKDFAILSKLGQGAYSSVYKVQRKADEQIYALKKVKMNNLSQKQQQNALNQVRILASIKCPQVVGYKHAFIQSNSLCIVMQFADDGDLYQKIVEHQKMKTYFEQEQIWRILIHIIKGLKTLHQLNILHRDLKSANVFLNKDGTSKLGDMNVSKIAKNGLLYTQTGTPYYASPQVWKDKPYDSKSDIWSLGCVIYQMTTLKPPFRAEDMDGLYKKIIKGSYTSIGEKFSKGLSNLIKSMLQVNPNNRPSAEQLYHSLQHKMEELSINLEQKSPKNELLKTIRVQNKLHYLTDRLPKSNYQNGVQYEPPTKLRSQSTKPKIKGMIHSPSINLPKLDRLIIKHGGANYQSPLAQKKKIELNNILKVEGNQYKRAYDYQYQEEKRIAQKDLQSQLKKIYNIKSNHSKKQKKKNLGLLPPIL